MMESPIKSAAGNRCPGDELENLELEQGEVSDRCEGGAQAVEGKRANLWIRKRSRGKLDPAASKSLAVPANSRYIT